MILQIKKILLEDGFRQGIDNRIKKIQEVPNYRNAVAGAAAAPVIGPILGGAIGNQVHGNGGLNQFEAGKMAITNPDEYNQLVDDDEYDGSGAMLGLAAGAGLSPLLFNQVRKNRNFIDKFGETLYDADKEINRKR